MRILKVNTGNITIIFRKLRNHRSFFSKYFLHTIFHPEKNTHYFRYSCLKIKFKFIRLQFAMLNYELHEGWEFIEKNYIRFKTFILERILTKKNKRTLKFFFGIQIKSFKYNLRWEIHEFRNIYLLSSQSLLVL